MGFRPLRPAYRRAGQVFRQHYAAAHLEAPAGLRKHLARFSERAVPEGRQFLVIVRRVLVAVGGTWPASVRATGQHPRGKGQRRVSDGRTVRGRVDYPADYIFYK